ncbi:MAG TPA: hypothetical protein PKW82_01310 [Spirochaetales bacterium]|nr:hypothetical protein [Spirochaetales bacterium]
MKNITLSADEALIEEARRKASSRRSTLNDEFRVWLASYVGEGAAGYDAIMADFEDVDSGRHFTRDEANER